MNFTKNHGECVELGKIVADFISYKSEIIYNFFWHWVNKISEWTLVTSFVVNIANMVFGFINFKKKWWYYVILLISILLSVILIDCWWMLYTAE